jgi:hypothetical protein
MRDDEERKATIDRLLQKFAEATALSHYYVCYGEESG